MFVDETTTFWTNGIPITFYEIIDWYEKYCSSVSKSKIKIPDPHFSENACYYIAKQIVKEMERKIGGNFSYSGFTQNYEDNIPHVQNTISTFVNDPETKDVNWFDQNDVMKKALDAMEKKWKEKQKEEEARQKEAAEFWKNKTNKKPVKPFQEPIFNWRMVLGMGTNEVVNEDTIKRYYRKEAMKRHPDKGGSTEKMQELFKARDLAYRFIGKDPP